MLKFKSTYFFLLSKCFTLLFLFVMNTSIAQLSLSEKIVTGANQTEKYLHLLKGKKIAVVANQTSVIEKKNPSSINDEIAMTLKSKSHNDKFTHLVDSLLAMNINITKVFAPEHGFRGQADAGEHVSNQKDIKTGLPIISLYGKNRKPKADQLKDVDLVIFDIQDVGVRFYTYISTMTYVMEASAERGIPVIILDRPNPNGHYIDGPMLQMEHKSFVGMHPVPLVYGMTIGEYAQMVNGEKWMENQVECELTIVHLKNYSHDSSYELPIRPSPNLPNAKSINLYPSLGFFEGTIVNAGRGTEFQFQRYGAPFFPEGEFSYTPVPNFGSKQPKFKGEVCFGVDLSNIGKLSKVDFQWIIDAYQKTPKNNNFFGKSFTVHAGNMELRLQMEAGKTAQEIRASWQSDVEDFKMVRSKYLIYE